MIAEFKHTLRRLRGQIIGWGIGIGLYGLIMVALFDTVQQMEGLQDFIDTYPPEMMAFFGGMTELTTPQGYLDTYYFSYMTLIIGIFVAGAAASLLVGDEEKGILDLVLAHPVSRTALFWGRLLGLLAATLLVLLVGWLSWAVPAGSTSMDLTWLEFLRPFVPLLAVLVVFGALALLLSMVLPAGRIAGMLTGALLFGNFLLSGLANLNDKLQPVVELTPLYYYQGGKAVSGINWQWAGGLALAGAILALPAWILFQRRDIRVAGERSWRLPRLTGWARRP